MVDIVNPNTLEKSLRSVHITSIGLHEDAERLHRFVLLDKTIRSA